MIDRKRLVAPTHHRQVLIEPPISRVLPADFETCSVRKEDYGNDACLRQIVGVPAHTRPVIVTGHQAEFFHAGVLAKLIAADELARRSNGTALFLIVDTDESKQHAVAVPRTTNAGLQKAFVKIPGAQPHTPVCDLRPVSQREWTAFFAELASDLPHYDISLLPAFAESWCRRQQDSLGFVERWQDAMEHVCQVLGFARLSFVRMTQWCESTAFAGFFLQIASHAAQFASHYNRAIDQYRDRHRIKSKNRPVPPLLRDQNRVELPFWFSRPGEPRRHMYVEQSDDGIRFFADAVQVAYLPRETDRTNDTPPTLPSSFAEWRVFPRALALSAFSRLRVADLFIHGIGGAKYDEVTTDFMADFFAAAVAPIVCVTASLHAPLPKFSETTSDLRTAEYKLRDLAFNPQRYIASIPPALLKKREAAIQRSDALRAAQGDARERRLEFEEIRKLNYDINNLNASVAAQLEAEAEDIRSKLAANRIAEDREYFFALHTRKSLDALKAVILSEISSVHAAVPS